MLKLRRGVVVSAEPLEVEIEVAGLRVRRPAWADPGLIGPCEEGDEVIVNTAAVDLGLGSGGFDLVHVNLTRGLGGGEAPAGVHVMKLNYSSLQHPVDPVEAPAEAELRPRRRIPVLVVPLHGHLAPACWSVAEARPGARVGYLQTAGAALPGALSRDVADLRGRGLLVETITAAPTYGGDHEAISVTGGLHAAAELGWDVAIAGPGPGILGSATRHGHGGMAALDTLHGALALRLRPVFSPRMSIADPRPRHRGLSHHSRSVLDLALASVSVAQPRRDGLPTPADAESGVALLEGLAELSLVCSEHHDLRRADVDLDGYVASGLPRRTMGRDLDEDPLFFATPLAAGAVAAEQIPEG